MAARRSPTGGPRSTIPTGWRSGTGPASGSGGRSTTRPGSSTPAISTRRPKGFGLIQRDRVFDHYLDGVGYDRRPSTWVEPLGDWGKGMVQLVEIPTDDEIHDNIAAYWLTDRPTTRGRRVQLSLPPALGEGSALLPRRPAGAGGRDPHGPRRPARQAAPARRLQVHGRVHGRHAGQPALRRPARAGDLGRPRHHLAGPDGGGARRRAGPLAPVLRPHGRRARSRSTCACSCARATPCSARPGSTCSSPTPCAASGPLPSRPAVGVVGPGSHRPVECSTSRCLAAIEAIGQRCSRGANSSATELMQ